MAKSALLEHARQICRLKHFSLKTEKAYLTWIRRFILFNKKRHPKEMGEEEISKYLTFLADKANVSDSTQNQFRYHPAKRQITGRSRQSAGP